MSSTFPPSLIFGRCGELPQAPEGWEFIEDAEDFLMIRQAETGSTFIVQHDGGWLTILPVEPNDARGKNESAWQVTSPVGKKAKKLCKWDKSSAIAIAPVVTIEAEYQKYRAAAMKDYRMGKLSERDMRQAFYAGCFVAFHLQGSLISLPIDQGAAILTALMDESTKACLDHVKAALAKRN